MRINTLHRILGLIADNLSLLIPMPHLCNCRQDVSARDFRIGSHDLPTAFEFLDVDRPIIAALVVLAGSFFNPTRYYIVLVNEWVVRRNEKLVEI